MTRSVRNSIVLPSPLAPLGQSVSRHQLPFAMWPHDLGNFIKHQHGEREVVTILARLDECAANVSESRGDWSDLSSAGDEQFRGQMWHACTVSGSTMDRRSRGAGFPSRHDSFPRRSRGSDFRVVPQNVSYSARTCLTTSGYCAATSVC